MANVYVRTAEPAWHFAEQRRRVVHLVTRLGYLAAACLLAGAVAGENLPRFGDISATSVPTGIHNAKALGAVGDGSSDDATNLQSILSAISSAGGELFLPCGKYKAATALTATIAAGKSVRIQGVAPECVTIYFPNNSGLSFTFASPFSSIHIRDVTITGGLGNGSGNSAISLSYGSFYGNPALTAQNDFTNVTVRGDDAFNGADYWTNCYTITNVSNVNWFGGSCLGSSSRKGSGVLIQGDAAVRSFGVAYNFSSTTFTSVETGITYGSWVQGVTLNQVNISNSTTGIRAPSVNTGVLHGLNIVNSQFGVVGRSIDIEVSIGGIGIVNSLFEVDRNVCAISLVNVAGAAIIGNQFNGNSGDTLFNNQGICLAGGGFNTIVGNALGALTTAVDIASGSNNNIDGSNTYNTIARNVSDGGASSNVGYQRLGSPLYMAGVQWAVNSGGNNILYTGDGANQGAFLNSSFAILRGPSVLMQNFGGATTYGTFSTSGLKLGMGRYNAPLHTPASSSEACTVGDFVDDASFHYVCTAANTWKRAGLSAF
jgi:hypothetical protein